MYLIRTFPAFLCTHADSPQSVGVTDIDGTATITSQVMPGEFAMYVMSRMCGM